MSDLFGEQPHVFNDYKPILISDKTAETFDLLRAQTGLKEREIINLVMGLGVDVLSMLIRAGTHEKVEPVLDLTVRQASEEPVTNIAELEPLLGAELSLSGLIEAAKRRTA